VFGWIIIVGGVLLGILVGILGVDRWGGGFNWQLAISLWSTSLFNGTLVLGFAEVINLLEGIQQKIEIVKNEVKKIRCDSSSGSSQSAKRKSVFSDDIDPEQIEPIFSAEE